MTTAVDLLRGRSSLPSRAATATQVLALIDDPDVETAELARTVGADPVFAARVIALANSAYFGLGGRVGTLQYAISVVGFQAVRALAVSIAAGLEGPNAVPAGFWEQAATAATAATLVAPILEANPADAFCLGLLHTLGSAILHQHQPLAELCLPFPADADQLLRTEITTYHIDHAQAGALVLSSWRFPERLCTLIANHHDVPLPDASPLERTLHAARSLTDLALSKQADGLLAEHTLRRLTEGKVTSSHLNPLVDQVRTHSAALLEGLRLR